MIDAGFPRGLRLSDRLRRMVTERILEGTYPPDMQLKEQALADEFQTSQTPVHEALYALELIGLVRSQPHRGHWVCGVDSACLAEAYELRATLEERAAQLAVPCRAQDLLTLSHALIDLERAAVAQDVLGYSGAIQNFHRRIIMMSGNREFLRVWDFQHWEIRTRVAAQHALHDLVNFIDGHQAALKALSVGDGIGAGQHLRGLIHRLLYTCSTVSAGPSTDH